jgi:predicted Rossmann-fold nucleotide-binding protein
MSVPDRAGTGVIQVAVIGSGAEHEDRAERVGRLLAERGSAVVTGGLGEVMAAAMRGAKAAGGTTIGIVPGESRAQANPWCDHVVATAIGHGRNLAVVASGDAVIAVGWCDHVVATAIGHGRNLAVVASGDAVIAVGGSWGTLAEIGYARVLGRRVVVLEPGWEVDGLERAATPEDAVERALSGLG